MFSCIESTLKEKTVHTVFKEFDNDLCGASKQELFPAVDDGSMLLLHDVLMMCVKGPGKYSGRIGNANTSVAKKGGDDIT